MFEIERVKAIGSSSNVNAQTVLPFAVQFWKIRNLNGQRLEMVLKASFDLQKTTYLALCL